MTAPEPSPALAIGAEAYRATPSNEPFAQQPCNVRVAQVLGGNQDLEKLPGCCHSRVKALLLRGESNASKRSITKTPGCWCRSHSSVFYLAKPSDNVL